MTAQQESKMTIPVQNQLSISTSPYANFLTSSQILLFIRAENLKPPKFKDLLPVAGLPLGGMVIQIYDSVQSAISLQPRILLY